MKQKTLVVGSLCILGMLLLGTLAIALPNRVHWNPMLEECVYFYTPEKSLGAHCFVDETQCEGSLMTINKNVDTSKCYYTPRKQQPQPAPTGCQEFVEGDLIQLDYSGSDPDKNVGPAGKLIYTIGKPFDKDSKWQTKRGDAGTYTVPVKVSDGQYESTDSVCFKILPGNHAPTLSVESVVVDEGETIKIRPTCADEDGDALQISYSGAMTSDTWKTSYSDSGTYKVVVLCKEAKSELKDVKTVTITVNDVNRVPVLSVSDVTVSEGEVARIKPSCNDPEGAGVTYSYTGDMTSDMWQTGYDDAGEYKVTVTCKDTTGKQSQKTILLTVLDRNRPPAITAVVKRA